MDIESLPGIATIFAGFTIFFLGYALFAPVREKKKNTLAEETFGEAYQEEEVKDGLGKYAKPILKNFLPQMPGFLLTDKQLASTKKLIDTSGNPWKLTPEELIGIQLAFSLTGAFGFATLAVLGELPINIWLMLVIGAALGYAVPYSAYNSQREKRAREIRQGLPEALDLLTVTLNSGSTFQPALDIVTKQMPKGVLQEEFAKMNLALQSGLSIEDALTRFMKANASEEAESFVRAIIQNQRLGSDVSETLSNQAQLTRTNQEARIQRMIARLNTTMFIPLIGTMMPAFLIIFLAPTMSSLDGAL